MNLACTFVRIAAARPEKTAMDDGVADVSFGTLDERSSRVASFLIGKGVESGDRVGIHMTNCVEYLIVAFGIWKAGAVLVPFNVAMPRGPLRHATGDSGVRIVFADAAGIERFARDCADLDVAQNLVGVRALGASDIPPARWAYEDALASVPLPAPVPRLDGENAILMYTSGSTGKPKGVQQTHRNTTAAVQATSDVWNFTEDERAVICTPFFHVGGMQLTTLPVLLSGATVHSIPNWDAGAWRDVAVKIDATFAALVPTMVVDVANRFESDPVTLSAMRVCAIGGSVLPTGPVDRFVKATGITTAVNIYGQTEQSGLSSTERSGEQERPYALGRPLEQIIQWRLTVPGGDEEIERGPDQIGELQVRGDAVTPGYWNLPEVNAAKFVDGWFRTGDLVRVDADGVLHYVERIDEMIISGGENIYPQLIENYLASSPDVAEVAVIGTAHERWMQQVTAIIVPQSPDVTVDTIVEYCARHPDLQGLQKPRRIELVDALPRTGSNKVDRPELKRQFR